MQLSVSELAKLVNGSVEGDPEVLIDRPSRIEEGGEGSISFLGNDRYEEFVYSTTASALLVSRTFQPRRPVKPTLIRVDNVYETIARLLQHFEETPAEPQGISGQALIHPQATIGKDVAVGAFAVIEAQAHIGDGCRLYPQVYIGAKVKLGRNVTLYPGVRILHNCVVGDHCVIHPNAVIGSDGFGFAPDEKGEYRKIPQTGNVIIGNHVEIGAGTTIDRASIGSTIIHPGVKLDNLIQIAHNASVGKHTVIAAQTGVAGSTKIGEYCQIGGQVGFVGHVQVADRTRIQAQSGVAAPVEHPDQSLFGSPAFGYRDYLRSYALFKRLPDLYKRIHELEQRLNSQQPDV